MANRSRAAAAAKPPGKRWTAEETADFLRIEVQTLHNWANLRKGPPWRKVGKQRLYDPAAVEKWWDEQPGLSPAPGAQDVA